MHFECWYFFVCEYQETTSEPEVRKPKHEV